MLEWLKKISGTGTIKNSANLPSQKLTLMAKEFARLDKLKAGICEKILRYIVDNEEADVLLQLGGLPQAGKTIGLKCCLDYSDSSKRELWQYRREFFADLVPDMPGLYARLSRVYEAVSSAAPRKRFQLNIPGVAPWLEILLIELVDYYPDMYHLTHLQRARKDQPKPGLSVAYIEHILEAGDAPADMFNRAVLLADPDNYSTSEILRRLHLIPGFYQRLSVNHAPVRDALNHKNPNQRIYALKLLASEETDKAPFKNEILTLALSSAKTVRKEAEILIYSQQPLFLEGLKTLLVEGTNSQRYHAVNLLWKMQAHDAHAFLKERLDRETAPKVKEAIAGFLQQPAAVAGPAAGGHAPGGPGSHPEQTAPLLHIPPMEETELNTPLPDEASNALRTLFSDYNQAMRKRKAQLKSNRYFSPFIVPDSAVDNLLHFMSEGRALKPGKLIKLNILFYGGEPLNKAIAAFLASPSLTPVHVVRLLYQLNLIQPNPHHDVAIVTPVFEHFLLLYRRGRALTFDLRQAASILETLNIKKDHLAWGLLCQSGGHIPFSDEAQMLWPFFAENLYLLEEALEFRPRKAKIADYFVTGSRQKALRILARFPVIPPQFQAHLWEMALSASKSEGDLARACLEKVPGRENRVLEALKSGKQEQRAVAAAWLAQLKPEGAVPALKAALKKEKSDMVKGEMFETLEKLGVSVEEFLDRDALKKEAARALKKGVPNALSWFPLEGLPVVHWADSGGVVDREIITWLLLLSFKLKSPEPGPLLRKYCRYMNPAQRARLGAYVLSAWMTQDTLPLYNYDEAVEKAKLDAAAIAQWHTGKTADDFFQSCLKGLLQECKGSAVKEKGLLALSAACCDGSAAVAVESYLKKWYGQRASQCKALVRMLGWIREPMVIQLLLSVSNRFRTKSIREEARLCVDEMAQRQGWSIDQLADRTIPAAGFDASAQMELDYGGRTFTCRLTHDFDITITNPAGKTLKALPNAAKADDPDLVKEAKKTLSSAKKMLKTVLKLQKERLYESMCLQRRWRFDELDAYLFKHPILSRYCSRLVWVIVEEGETQSSFRLMEDGTLTDSQDNEVTPPASAVVSLAHTCNMNREMMREWEEHFRDYEVEPLFTQFRKDVYQLSEADKEATELREFEGYMLDNFKLRGAVKKLGYNRGRAEDGGIFCTYHKPFPGSKLEAVIEFSGSPLPEENTRIALMSFYFRKLEEKDTQNDASSLYDSISLNRLKMKDVPQVLLSETWNDMNQLSQMGSGYDKDWEKNVTY